MKKASLICSFFLFPTLSLLAQTNWLDNTFGSAGIFSQDSMYTNAMLIQQDNKIVLGGGDVTYPLLRLNENGVIDSSFGKNGYVLTPPSSFQNSSWAQVLSLTQQQDGKILAAGTAGYVDGFMEDIPTAVYLVRYTTTGVIDSSFGVNGIVENIFGNEWSADATYNVVVGNTGKILVAMVYTDINYGLTNAYSGLECFDSTGRIDSSFGNNGILFTPSSHSQFMLSMALQPDQKILFGGSDSASSTFPLMRYTAMGYVDSTFGIDGITGIDCDDSDFGGFNFIYVQNDGGILATKYLLSAGVYNFKLSRFTSSGSIDSTFGESGCVQTTFPNARPQHELSSANFIAQYSNGNILIGGLAIVDSLNLSKGFAFARYLSNGTLDSTFGVNGLLTKSIINYAGFGMVYLSGLSIVSNDKFVATSAYETDRYLNSVNVGITEVAVNNNNIQIYPDPAIDKVNIRNLPHDATITITDMTGRVCNTPVTENQIDVSALPAGVYSLRIQDSSGSVVRKFVKQ